MDAYPAGARFVRNDVTRQPSTATNSACPCRLIRSRTGLFCRWASAQAFATSAGALTPRVLAGTVNYPRPRALFAGGPPGSNR